MGGQRADYLLRQRSLPVKEKKTNHVVLEYDVDVETLRLPSTQLLNTIASCQKHTDEFLGEGLEVAPYKKWNANFMKELSLQIPNFSLHENEEVSDFVDKLCNTMMY
ncbi:hypothetical protein NDU88_006800 [Pleurodeles waltl]|uniref:Uncharacterized protein n=1 Tax=Pleurodeles waltl TaxID=8319 RepID=A0AAV7X2C7_PLEWA|nr:hypothetical protein NDU88_006800 [Pleurodeles waltl]